MVDALEGNDRFFIESTSESVAIEIVGGLGSDTFHVGGSNGTAVTVVSNDLEGHSGLAIQSTTTDDPNYRDIFVRDVSVDVRDNEEAEVVVLFEIGPIRVFENGLGGILTVNSYQVVLSRAPEENVTVKAVPVALRESVLKAGGKGVALSVTTDANLADENGIELTFNRNDWWVPQTVYVFAPQDTLAEGTNGFTIVHRTQQGSSPKDGGAYDGLAVLGVVAMVVDDDAASVLIAPYDNSASFPQVFEPLVAEGGAIVGGGTDPDAPAALQTDGYWVVLTKAPTGNVVVNFSFDSQIEFVSATGPGVSASGNSGTISFTTSDWSTARKITVKAVNDTAREGTHYSRIVHTVDPATLNYFLGVTTGNVVAAHGFLAAHGFFVAQGLPFAAAAGYDHDNDPNTANIGLNDYATITGPAFRYNLGTPYTSATVTLGGVAAEGEVWALVVNGRTWFHVVDVAQTVADVAASLRAQIDADGVLVAVAAGSNGLTISAAGGGLVTVGFLVSGESAGTAAISGTQLGHSIVTVESLPAWTIADIDIDGTTPPAGAVWTLNLDGTEFRYTSKVDNESLNVVAAGLADAINQAGSRFAARYATATIKLTGTPREGDVWTVTVGSDTVDYTVLAGNTLDNIATQLATKVAAVTGYAATPTGAKFTINRTDAAPFAIKVSTAGTNLQSSGQITGTIASEKLIVFTTDGTPFTVNVKLAQSASQVDNFASGGTVRADDGAGPNASVVSTTHYSKLVLQLNPAVAPVLQGAGWELAVGTQFDRVGLDFSGTPTAGEVWTLRLNADGWITRASHVVTSGQTLQNVIDSLGAQIAAAGYTVVVATDDGDPAAPADDGTRLMTIERMGGFTQTLTIAPAVAGEQSAAQVAITNDQISFAFDYVAGSNREVTVPDSLDVTVADNDAPGVLILQSGESTDVIEPSEIVRLGSGFTSQVVEARFRIGLGPTVATPTAGQVWSVFLVRANNGATPPPSASFTVTTPTFSAVATGLASAITTSGLNTPAGSLSSAYTASASNEFLKINDIGGNEAFSVVIVVSEGGVTRSVIFVGDFGTSTVREIGVHDSVFLAQDLDTAKWNTNSSNDIQDAETLPHVTVLGTGDGNADFYSFEVTEEMLAAAGVDGVRVHLDIDHGYDFRDQSFWVSAVKLYKLVPPLDPSLPTLPTLIGESAFFRFPDAGSTYYYDGYLTQQIEETGTYYVEVTARYPFGLDGVPQGVDYQLHVSIENHVEDSFLFAPAPVVENETGNNSGQEIDPDTDAGAGVDRGLNFFTFFDPNVGNLKEDGTPYVVGTNPIDFTTPYVRITGTGDYSYDIYRFSVTPAPSGLTPTGASTVDGADFYSSVTYDLTGSVETGDVWNLGIGYRDYTVTANTTTFSTLLEIATEFRTQILQAQTNGYISGYSVDVTGTDDAPTLTITNTAAGFTLQGSTGSSPTGVEHEVVSAGTVTRTTSAKVGAGGTAISFANVKIDLAKTDLAAVETWILTVNGKDTAAVSVSSGTSLNAIAALLRTAVTNLIVAEPLALAGVSVVAGSNDIVELNSTTGVTVAVSISGANPRGSVTISGTPFGQPVADTPASVEDINWTDISIVLSGTVYQNEQWYLKVGSADFTHTAALGDTTANVAAAFRGAAVFIALPGTVGGSGSTISFSNVGSAAVEFLVTQAAPGAGAGTSSASIHARQISTLSFTSGGSFWVLSLPGLTDRYEAVAASTAATGANLVTWINGQSPYKASYDDTTKRLVIVRTDGTVFGTEPALVQTTSVTVTALISGSDKVATLNMSSLSDTDGKRWELSVVRSSPSSGTSVFARAFDTDRDTTGAGLAGQVSGNDLSAVYTDGSPDQLVVSRGDIAGKTIVSATLVAEELLKAQAGDDVIRGQWNHVAVQRKNTATDSKFTVAVNGKIGPATSKPLSFSGLSSMYSAKSLTNFFSPSLSLSGASLISSSKTRLFSLNNGS